MFHPGLEINIKIEIELNLKSKLWKPSNVRIQESEIKIKIKIELNPKSKLWKPIDARTATMDQIRTELYILAQIYTALIHQITKQ